MAARLIRCWRSVALAAVILGGCAGSPAPTAVPPAGDRRPTPMASLTAGAAAAQAQVGERLSSAGFALDHSVLAEWRPAEPAQLQDVPRAVLRIDLPDPRAGWLVIYDPGNALAAEQAGTAFANYLASNFGQASYPSDAQFVLNQVGGTLLFGWWAPSRLTDPDGTRAAYEALRGVGQRVPIGR